MDDYGFPPRLDNFKAMAQELAAQNAEQTGDPTRANIGCQAFTTVTKGFLKVWIQSGP